MNCIICNKKLTNRQKLFCSTKCKNIKHQNYKSQSERGKLRRSEFINLKGGKCLICGYNKNNAALSFHHTEDNDKEFKLSIRECSNNSIETLLKELEKCILLCANCHMELHYPHYNNIT